MTRHEEAGRDTVVTSASTSSILRFFQRVRRTPGCWEWHGTISGQGYGAFPARHGVKVYAHRFAYAHFYGEIPAGLYVCHRCDNRRCVRPDHLFLGTAQDNTNDMIAKGRMYRPAPRTHCAHGHALEGRNLVPNRFGHRKCRRCANDRQSAAARAKYAKKRRRRALAADRAYRATLPREVTP